MAVQLTPDILKCAVVMISRAQCTGEEAKNVAITIDTLLGYRTELMAALAAPPQDDEGDKEEDNGSDS